MLSVELNKNVNIALRTKVLAQGGAKKRKLANVVLLTKSFDYFIW
jgi:hypothetical protein